MDESVTFDSYEDLYDYVASEIAQFVRDNMFELNNHPMDYQDHYDYIVKVYARWAKEHLE